MEAVLPVVSVVVSAVVVAVVVAVVEAATASVVVAATASVVVLTAVLQYQVLQWLGSNVQKIHFVGKTMAQMDAWEIALTVIDIPHHPKVPSTHHSHRQTLVFLMSAPWMVTVAVVILKLLVQSSQQE